jgi:hypothetical protein
MSIINAMCNGEPPATAMVLKFVIVIINSGQFILVKSVF